MSAEERRQREKEARSREQAPRPAYRDYKPDDWDDIRNDIRASFLEESTGDFASEYPEELRSSFQAAFFDEGDIPPRREDLLERWEKKEEPPPAKGEPPDTPLPPGADRELDDWIRREKPAGRKKKSKAKWVILILVLLVAILAATGLLLHQIFVRAPELPPTEETTQEEGTNPGSMGAGRKDGVYTFLLVGRDDGGGGNTDTIMLGCFDTENKTLDVLSIFRDTLVDVPWEIKKINSVYNNQGIGGLQLQIKNLIGYVPDFYFVVELDVVKELVDAIGGVDYEVPYSMHYDDPTQDLHIHFEPGMQHITGEDAVRLLRWRKNNSGEAISVGDIGRVEVQHSFLKAMADQAVSLGNLPKIKKIAKIVDENLTTNLSYGEMIWFGEQTLKLGDGAIRFHTLPGDCMGTMWSDTYKNYQSYVFVNGDALLDIVNGYMNPYLIPMTADMQHILENTTVNNTSSEDSLGTTTDEEWNPS